MKPILLRAARAGEEARRARGKGERVERGDGGRDGDGERELPEKLAGNSGHERGRDKDRAKHERDGDQRAADFGHRFARRVARTEPVFDVVLDGFHHHDGVIDHDADREHEAEERDVVDRESESRHRRESADERDRNRDERDDRRAPGLEKDEHDENDQRDGFEERLLHFVDRLAHGGCRVVNDCVVEPGGEALLELSHLLAHGVGGGERVRAGTLENANRGGRFSAELAVDRVIARRQLDPRDIAHASDLSVCAGLDDDVAKLLFIREPALRADRVLKCRRAFRHRRRADDSRGDLHILLLDALAPHPAP